MEDWGIVLFSILIMGPSCKTKGRAYYLILLPRSVYHNSTNLFLFRNNTQVYSSWIYGTPPELAPHPYNNYSMGYAARNFVSALPYWSIPMGGLAGYLLGQQEWSQFLQSSLCKLIFSPTKDSESRNEMLQWAMNEAWRCMEDYLRCFEPLVERHQSHATPDISCKLCERHLQLADEDWWHTSEAARHVFKQVYQSLNKSIVLKFLHQCACEQCTRCKCWGHVSATNGCRCPRCAVLRNLHSQKN